MSAYADLAAITKDVAEIIRAPRRVAVSKCAQEVVRIETPGGYSGNWDAELTPYMAEPMDALKSRVHKAVVFVSPARTGKTQGLLDGWLAHSVVADPGDMGLYFSTQNLAYDFRKRRIERMHRNSKQIEAKLSPRKHDATIEMITYRNGMIVNIGWPSSSQLAQRDLRYVAFSDYDSFPDDVGGEGSPFELGRKRIETAMSAGMALVESSPKREIITDQWQSDGEHEAPPVAGGILPLYNRGDRRRWYWKCIDGCGERFEAPALPSYDHHKDPQQAAKTAHVGCPHCGQIYKPRDKRRLNASGKWLAENWQKAEPRTSDIASFWLLGCAAAFQSWGSIVANQIQSEREAEQSGDETALRATTNTDQGMPYRPQKLDNLMGVSALSSRQEPAERYMVPDGVRCLFGLVDVQARSFEVSVIGYGENRERWLVDRFAIAKTAEGAPIRPATSIEDWEILYSRVIFATYRLDDGREMRLHRVAVDSGGYADRSKGADTTRRAYEWWRSLKARRAQNRVLLVKGDKSKAKLVSLSYPDSSRRSDRHSGSRGDVPVLLIATDRMKNALHADMQRDTPGPGYVHIPDWVPKSVLDELTCEARDEKGRWNKAQGQRNETWDHFVYGDALWHYLGGESVNWDRPPAWLAPIENNVEVITADQRRALIAGKPMQQKPASGAQRKRKGWVSGYRR